MASFGVAIPTYGEFKTGSALVDLLQATEELGYADAWFADHVVIPEYCVGISGDSWLEPLATCFIGLGATKTLRFGTDVLVVPYRNPVLVAEMVATADRISGGRMTLGLGVGYISGEFAALSSPPYEDRGAVTEEYVQVMRALWETDGAVSFDGRWVQLDQVHAEPKPAQAPLPLWIGGNHPKAWTRAARLGDGWHPLFPDPEQYTAARAVIEAERAAVGRAGRTFTYSYSCPATQLLDRPGAPGGLQTYEDFPDLPAEFSYAPPMPTGADGRALFIGDPDQMRADVAAYAAAGVDHFTLRFYTGGIGGGPKAFIDQLEFFAREVF